MTCYQLYMNRVQQINSTNPKYFCNYINTMRSLDIVNSDTSEIASLFLFASVCH